MRGKDKNADMYFSSSDDEPNPTKITSSNYMDTETPPPTHKYSTVYQQAQSNPPMINDVLSLTGPQLMDIFCNQTKLQQYFKLGRENCSIGVRFCWRMHFFIGEVVINVQEFLISRQKLSNGILLDQRHIDKIAMFFLRKMNQNAKDMEFLKAKENINQMYKFDAYEYKMAAELYSYFVRIVYTPFNFEMVIQNKHKVGPTINGVHAYNPPPQNVAMPMERNQYNNGQPFKPQPQQNLESSVQQIPNTDKNQQQKWSSKQQADLCQIYACHDSSQACCQLLQQKLGPDPRWKTGQQIQQKMCTLVAKVFNKFMTLNTKNEYIKVFRQNKKLVLKETDLVTRKKIFRSIAVIYESMLNVDQHKKTIISQKILQVNRYCRDFLSLK